MTTLRTPDAHAALAVSALSPLDGQRVPLADAAGRTLAADVVALHATPPFDNSSMDGYAVLATDTALAAAAAPTRLRIVGESRAGTGDAPSVEPGTAVRVMTGAPMPPGATAVVPQELVTVDHGDAVLTAPATPGDFVRRRGEDVSEGELLARQGEVLNPFRMAALAASGHGDVEVVRKPRIGYLVTGDELVQPGLPLRAGQIHDSNGIYLATAVRELGAEPVNLGTVGDAPGDVVSALTGVDCDVVITTGGASVGAYDPVKAALAPLGIDFTEVAMQPGKPQGIGTLDGTLVLCFPGNPVAVAVSCALFAEPVIRAMLGQAPSTWEPTVALEGWASPVGREQFIPVVMSPDGVRPASGGGSASHLMGRLARAQGLARVPAEVAAVEPGDRLFARRLTP